VYPPILNARERRELRAEGADIGGAGLTGRRRERRFRAGLAAEQ
jgi:hypothetical protein